MAPTEPAHYLHRFTYFKGGHPLPTQESVSAARFILRELHHLNEFALVIFLISGGGSALAESPLYESISLEDMVQTYQILVHSGAPIKEINAIRKHLSSLKGGRMAAAAAPAHQASVLISDVPENALDALASGPTMPDLSTTEDCYRIAAKYGLIRDLPPSVAGIVPGQRAGGDAEAGRLGIRARSLVADSFKRNLGQSRRHQSCRPGIRGGNR